MPTSHMNRVIQHLSRAVLQRDGAGMTDGQLLKRFLEELDESAFEALVRRHGPMVMGVCRRVLRNDHDAQDAYQAAFLVLVRKAATIVPREMVGNWLYGVAYQTALKARAVAAKRSVKERQVAVTAETEAAPHNCCHDLQSLLDQELSRLPEKYRVPLVLCSLEGRSHKEAARLLGWPQGTLSVRLAKAKKMLADRLARQGVGISGGLITMVLSQNAVSACVPPSLVLPTVKAAKMLAVGQVMTTGMVPAKVVALTEGVVKAMLLTKLKVLALVLLAMAVLGTGAGWLGRQARAGQVPSGPAEARDKGSPKKSPVADATQGAPQFAFRCKVVQVREDGQERRVTAPVLVAQEGKSASFLAGGEQAIEGVNKEGQAMVGFDPFGVRLELQADMAQEGKVRLHVRFEVSEKENEGDKARVSGRFIRGVETVLLGETVRLTLKDDQGRVRHRAEIKVEQARNP
jgi:RNA polymerase sigma factor (sigma-70 family)